MKPWHPTKQRVKTWSYAGRLFKAGVDVGYPGEKPSPIYKFEDDKDPLIEYLLGVSHPRIPGVLVFEEVKIEGKDDLEKTIEKDLADRVEKGGQHIRAHVQNVLSEPSEDSTPKRRKNTSTNKKNKGRKKPNFGRSTMTEE
jgi:hypothetical protein